MCLIISRREQTLHQHRRCSFFSSCSSSSSTRQHQNKNRCCFVSPFCLTSPLCLLLLAGSSSSSQVCPQTPRRRLTLASLHPNQRRRLVWFNCSVRRNPLRNGFRSECLSCRVDERQFVQHQQHIYQSNADSDALDNI